MLAYTFGFRSAIASFANINDEFEHYSHASRDTLFGLDGEALRLRRALDFHLVVMATVACLVDLATTRWSKERLVYDRPTSGRVVAASRDQRSPATEECEATPDRWAATGLHKSSSIVSK